ncbi:MAG: sugar phosphate nucleotidyltransferase, partial [candidate division WOR-3 bacterium]
MNAIILSAGLGKRLGNITKKIPKPLLPINGTPVIKLIIKKLKRAGIKNIGINLFYKADLIKKSLQDLRRIEFVIEKYLSGTGGALLHFKNFVSEDFLIHNCDILSNIDLKKALKKHKKIKPLATIVLVKNYKTNPKRLQEKNDKFPSSVSAGDEVELDKIPAISFSGWCMESLPTA